MSKLIFRSNYFKNESATHKSNYIKYLGTREGVEMNPEMMPRFFYEDVDMHGKKENYIDYISGRPGVVFNENEMHGLFSNPGLDINLEQVMDEVANHKGTVWINVISLRREDAEKLGLNNIESWQNLLRSHIGEFADSFNINPCNLRWYAAFHNESHHPHVHMVIYSENPKEGFLKKKGINSIKSSLLNDVFKDELRQVYSDKSQIRAKVKEQARDSLLSSLAKLENANMDNSELNQKMRQLGHRLKNISGKKVYGYLHKDVKEQVNDIVAEIAKIPEVAEIYDKWKGYKIAGDAYYSKAPKEPPPLELNKEFRSIANMVIQESINLVNEEDQAIDSSVACVARMLKNMERIFNDAIEDNKHQANIPIKDKKTRKKEAEKKKAHGQKADDGEQKMTQNM